MRERFVVVLTPHSHSKLEEHKVFHAPDAIKRQRERLSPKRVKPVVFGGLRLAAHYPCGGRATDLLSQSKGTPGVDL